jgi:TonB-linked SusC/RagA family outer membrane protein
MRKLTFLLALIFVGVSVVLAQTTYSGKVVSAEDGEPIVGATVMVKGTTTGTITNVNGNFTIALPGSNRTLVITYVGMKSMEVQATQNMVVRLEADTEVLDEVLVVAYGTTTKQSFTGAAVTVKGEKLSKGETSNITKSLEGAIAGVQISSSTGQPGSSAAIRIRGLGSVSASQSPLIVVDGVPYEGSLNTIAPQDIETLNVLKDAAANSMYGARGSNGVILITTKKGVKGETKVTLDARVGMNSRAVPAYDVMTDPGDYYEMSFEAIRNSLVEGGVSMFDANRQVAGNLISNHLGYNIFKGVADGDLIDPYTGQLNPNATNRKWNDSWLNDPFRNGTKQEYNLSVQGGNDKTSAYMSAFYLNDQGYVINSDFSRLGARVKIDQTINDKIKAGMNVAYTKTTSNSPIAASGDLSFSNIFNFSSNVAPIYPIYKYDLATGAPVLDTKGVQMYDFGSVNFENGAPSTNTRAYAGEQNPMYKLSYDSNQSINDNISSRVYVDIELLKDLKLTLNGAYDVFNSVVTDFTNPLQGDGKNYGGIGYKISQRYEALNLNQLLNYNKKFGLHTVTALLGHESKTDNIWYLEGSKMNFYNPFNPEFSNAGATNGLTSYTAGYRLEGYLSRAEYNYADKYYVSGSFRRDASSKFAPDVRWGNFWSVGASWRIKEESFLKDVDAIENLKLRASYGTQGNDGISGTTLYLDQYTMTSDGQNVSPTLSYRAAPDLTWEKSNNFNVGIDLNLFERVNLVADYFVKETKDMIYQKPLPPSIGTPTWVWDNQIDMKNTGVEIELTVDLVKTRNIKWDVAVNMTTYKNELTKVPDDKDPNGYIAGAYWRKLGGTLYDFYTYEYAGVDAATGKSTWFKDVKKTVDGVEVTEKQITSTFAEATRYETGKSALPDFYGGISSNLTAYGFDFSIATAFQSGGWVNDVSYQRLMTGGQVGQNWHKDIYKRWTPTNTVTDVPRVSTSDQNANAGSTRFLTDASYFNIKNITLGYTLPKRVLENLKIESVRIYATADNLLLLTARTGLDTRQSFSGTTYEGTYSALRTTSLGLSVKF